MVPKGLLTFLGFLGNVEFSTWKRPPEFIDKVIKKFAVVFVTASDAMDFFVLFTNCVMFLR